MARKKRGSDYEAQVAQMFEREKGARKTTLNEWVKGHVATRPHECDVHVEFFSGVWEWLWVFAMVAVCAGAVVVGFAFFDAEVEEGVVSASSSVDAGIAEWLDLDADQIAGVGVIVLGALLWIFAVVAKDKTERHVWVECKDLKSPIKRDHINKLHTAVEDVRKAGGKWTPQEVWLVSASRFDQDALDFAKQHRIQCLHLPKQEPPA